MPVSCPEKAVLDQAEIERRRPVWIALSDLWLDTELRDQDLRGIAKVMRESGYSVSRLRDIYRYEVAPAVYKNLHAPAGAWAGFDPEWLSAEAETYARNRSVARKVLLRLKQHAMTSATEQHWKRLEHLLAGEEAV